MTDIQLNVVDGNALDEWNLFAKTVDRDHSLFEVHILGNDPQFMNLPCCCWDRNCMGVEAVELYYSQELYRSHICVPMSTTYLSKRSER